MLNIVIRTQATKRPSQVLLLAAMQEGKESSRVPHPQNNCPRSDAGTLTERLSQLQRVRVNAAHPRAEQRARSGRHTVTKGSTGDSSPPPRVAKSGLQFVCNVCRTLVLAQPCATGFLY